MARTTKTNVYRLDTFEGLDAALSAHSYIFTHGDEFTAREATCPRCATSRNVDFKVLRRGDGGGTSRPGLLLGVECRECHTSGYCLLFTGPQGGDLAYHWPVLGGLTTPNTPPGVAYYLDQAARSESACARSAAMAMYRAALEHLLFEQGYQDGMLHQKLTALQRDIDAKTAEKWALDIDPGFLRVIKDLGNGAIHPNGGDHTKQEAIDATLLDDVRETVRELLDVVYEEPLRRANRLSNLRSAAKIVT
ncbi:MAG: DUF4145 domain-containing protein [Kofleriaceae bacterium]